MKNLFNIILKYVSDMKAISLKKDKQGKLTGGVTFKSLDLPGLQADKDFIEAQATSNLNIRTGEKGHTFEYKNDQGYLVKSEVKEDYAYVGPDTRKEYKDADDIMSSLRG